MLDEDLCRPNCDGAWESFLRRKREDIAHWGLLVDQYGRRAWEASEGGLCSYLDRLARSESS